MTTTATIDTLRARHAPAIAHRDALLREAQRIFDLTSPSAIDGPSASRVDVLRARARESTLRADLAEARVEIAEIEVALKAAEEVEREKRRAEFHRRKRPLVAALDEALSKAAAANAKLAALEEVERAAVGGGEVFGWHELFDETPTNETRLAAWRRHASSHGLL